MLADRRSVTPGDAALLALAAQISVRMVAAKRDVDSRGLTVTMTTRHAGTESEREALNPMLKVLETAEKNLVACLDRLGLTPLNRERVRPAAEANKKPEPSLDDLVDGTAQRVGDRLVWIADLPIVLPPPEGEPDVKTE